MNQKQNGLRLQIAKPFKNVKEPEQIVNTEPENVLKTLGISRNVIFRK